MDLAGLEPEPLLLGVTLGPGVAAALFTAFAAFGLFGAGRALHHGRSALMEHAPLAPFLASGAILTLFVVLP
jgi:hypothetical protein